MTRNDWIAVAAVAMASLLLLATVSSTSIISLLALPIVVGLVVAELAQIRMTGIVGLLRRNPRIGLTIAALLVVLMLVNASMELGWFGFAVMLWFLTQAIALVVYEWYRTAMQYRAQSQTT